MTSLTRPLRSLHGWFEATDPAAVRRRQGARAASAALCTWLTVREVTTSVSDRPQTAAVLFGVVACFVVSIVIADPRRRDRLVTTALGAALSIVMVVLAAYTSHVPFVQKLLLLVLVFVSFAARRFGLRAGELAMLAVMTLYFATSSAVSPGNIGWFAFATTVGVLWLAVWQYVLIPYDPRRSLEQAATAFYRRAGELVGDVGTRVRELGGDPPTDRLPDRLQQRLQLVGVSRRVLESQFPGTLAPTGWTRSGLSQMQLTMYSAEQGLGQMVSAVSTTDGPMSLQPQVADLAATALDALRAALVDGAQPGAMRELAARTADALGQIQQLQPSASSFESAARATRAIELVSGAQRVARSVATARELAVVASGARGESTAADGTAPAADAPRSQPGPQAMVGRRIKVRPGIAQGLQAVVATGLAMLVGSALGVDRVTWVYWSAFLVIAGSAGESLRRIMFRIGGTTLGAVCGVALALVLPDSTTIVVAIVTVSLFATIFTAPVSYPLMVCFLNVGFVITFTQLGARELDLLVDRPLATLLGGAVAALVTVAVFPIRVTERFRRALSDYLGLVGTATATMVERTVTTTVGDDVDPTWERANSMYRAIQQTMTTLAFENNPFSRTEAPLADKVVKVAAVDAAFNHAMTSSPAAGQGPTARQRVGALSTLQDLIQDDIAAIQRLLAGEAADVGPSPFKVTPADGRLDIQPLVVLGADQDGMLRSLASLRQSLVQLALSLGGSKAAADRIPSPANNVPSTASNGKDF